jgi:cyclase
MRIRSTGHVACLVSAVLWLDPAARAQDFDKVEIQTVRVTAGVWMLTGSGGNIGVLAGEDGVLLIDDESPQLVEKVKAAVAPLSGGGPIRFVLNTNWHFDHADGNGLLAKAGAIIVAHETSRAHMTREWSAPEFDPNLKIAAYPKAALPVITFRDSLTLHFNGDEVRAIHVPNAHSDGDVLYHLPKANVIHTGDLYFSNGFPFINVSSGGTLDGMIRAADEILRIADADTKVIPGHGALSDRRGVQSFRDMLATARARIARLVKEGKTLEEVIKAAPVADLYAGGQSFVAPELFVKVVYLDLARK